MRTQSTRGVSRHTAAWLLALALGTSAAGVQFFQSDTEALSAQAHAQAVLQAARTPLAASPVVPGKTLAKSQPAKPATSAQAPAKLATLEQKSLAQHIAETWRRPPEVAARIVRAAFETGAHYNVPPALLLAIAAQESSFNPQARSSYGAVGLMQVVPRWHPEKLRDLAHPEGLNHPESNIQVGARVLREYWDASGTLAQALRKYSGNATRYPDKVFGYWQQFESVRRAATTSAALASPPGAVG